MRDDDEIVGRCSGLMTSLENKDACTASYGANSIVITSTKCLLRINPTPRLYSWSMYMNRLLTQRLKLSLLRSHLCRNSSPQVIRGSSLSGLPCRRSKSLPLRQFSISSQTIKSKAYRSRTQPKQSSVSPYVVLLFLVSSSAILVDYVNSSPAKQETNSEELVPKKASHKPEHPQDDFAELFANMPIAQGFLGNLTADQEQKLKDFWAIVLQTFGVKDPAGPSTTGRPITPAESTVSTEPHSAKKEKHGLFHRKHKDSADSGSGSSSPNLGSKNDPEDKYGQTKELQEILATSTPTSLRDAFWSMVKKDHPDALLLRFLRARKWDKQRALAMLISTMHWRKNEMHVDDDIMIHGEGGALKDAQSSTGNTKKEGEDFLAQLRLGKSFIHGIDKEGRPMSIVRVRLHRGGEQSERALERFTVYTIETCRLALQGSVETAVS